MTEHEITIGSKTDPKTGVNLIAVPDQWIEVKQGDVVVFKNALGGGTDATVTFFATPDKAAPISGFCEGKIGPTLPVPTGGEAKCGIVAGQEKQATQIAYTISTPDSDVLKHVTLDPVIIIQPREARIMLPDLGFTSGLPAVLLLAVLGVALLAFGFRFGRTTRD